MASGSDLDKPTRGPHRTYTDEEREAGLLAYVLCSGHRERAAALVKEQGYEIPAKTIYYWATEADVERLERIRQEIAPALKAQMAEMHQGLAVAAGEIEAKAMERLKAKLDADEIAGKDLSAVMQRAGIATGIHSDKHLLYSGEPTQIVRRDFSEIRRALKAKGIDFDLEATAEDEEDGGEASRQLPEAA